MKIYKKYQLQQTFGLISQGNLKLELNFILTFMNEFLLIWDSKTFKFIKQLKMDSKISKLNLKNGLVCVGLGDGSVVLLRNLMDSSMADSALNAVNTSIDGQDEIKLNGHSRPITSLEFDSSGNLLLSASSDTDIVLWDLVEEIGIKRFQGHKDQVTCCKFVTLDYIISTSKDGTLKIWDVEQGICLETCLDHRGEVLCLEIVFNLFGKIVIFTGSADGCCRVFELDISKLQNKLLVVEQQSVEITRALTLKGTISRTNNEKIIGLKVLDSYLLIQGSDRIIQVFKIKNEQELKKLQLKKEKKGIMQLEYSDFIINHSIVNCGFKVKSFDACLDSQKLKIYASLGNNSIECYFVDSIASPSRLHSSVQLQGHRSDIRALGLSSDDQLLASGSSSELKLWNLLTGNCVSTFESGYCLCVMFLPGNKHLLVGTKSGKLELFEIASATLIESIDAHDGAIWSICMLSDKSGVVTGSQDKCVKFWSFQMIQDEEYSKV